MSRRALAYTGVMDSDFSRLLGRRIRWRDWSTQSNGCPVEREGEVIGWCKNRENDPCLVLQETCANGHYIVGGEMVADTELRLVVVSLYGCGVVILPKQPEPKAIE